MAARRRTSPVGLGRKLASPVRGYVNTHVNDLKHEIRLARDALAGSGADMQHDRHVLAASVERVRETADLVGIQMARLTGLHDELLARTAPASGHLGPGDVTWHAFVGRALRGVSAVVVVDADADPLVPALAALGYHVLPTAADADGASGPLALVVSRGELPPAGSEPPTRCDVVVWRTALADWASCLAGYDAELMVQDAVELEGVRLVSAARR